MFLNNEQTDTNTPQTKTIVFTKKCSKTKYLGGVTSETETGLNTACVFSILHGCELSRECEQSITQKLRSYLYQDRNKQYELHIKKEHTAMTLELVLQKMRDCRLQCYYCHQQTKILYYTQRDPLQWTLERVDNNYGHTFENSVIACLKCNLQRGTTYIHSFVASKRTIHKLGCHDDDQEKAGKEK